MGIYGIMMGSYYWVSIICFRLDFVLGVGGVKGGVFIVISVRDLVW